MGMNIVIIVVIVGIWLGLGWACGRITATRGYSKYLGWLLWYSLSFLGLLVCVCLRDKVHPSLHWQPFPADSSVHAQQLPPPMLFVGYIGVGSWFSRKYWSCPHNHRSPDEALVCARNQLNNGSWDGRVTHGG
jgi:hypothetical protein